MQDNGRQIFNTAEMEKMGKVLGCEPEQAVYMVRIQNRHHVYTLEEARAIAQEYLDRGNERPDRCYFNAVDYGALLDA